jgi:hypothetical protein
MRLRRDTGPIGRCGSAHLRRQRDGRLRHRIRRHRGRGGPCLRAGWARARGEDAREPARPVPRVRPSGRRRTSAPRRGGVTVPGGHDSRALGILHRFSGSVTEGVSRVVAQKWRTRRDAFRVEVAPTTGKEPRKNVLLRLRWPAPWASSLGRVCACRRAMFASLPSGRALVFAVFAVDLHPVAQDEAIPQRLARGLDATGWFGEPEAERCAGDVT